MKLEIENAGNGMTFGSVRRPADPIERELAGNVWICRSCSARTLHAGAPMFCSCCRSTRLQRLVIKPKGSAAP